ncbi:MAG TPA: UDP-N-acetylglucosamine pyrophosphorylase [Deltaproteobacteria bacterium]|nr:UDP-N-acetylglucosamine pyrophosphorylase [Deltaproteobacteria bacterium]HPR56331.1 UDP-N-acetylglucosamine pyrophosphorylase [Deltaproteobacteria bacterium]HXK48613.1 UDP-N-acetylglucosamine pyrophosphorylase [Deltaproteobacteria bacterium]
MGLDKNVKQLVKNGVKIPHPESVFIGEEIDPARISGRDVVIHSGCRVRGKKTLIMDGARLGAEAPVTLEDCQIGPKVELKGGFFRQSVFLEGANMASGAHVREACILEEGASCGHSVGIKQTILMPFVTLGSLINFCDCLMAGGTGKKDHSEVGSSYIHFNFTPDQDKATASLVGDVPRGVMLRERPIFLGGQGGLVGPCVIGFGTVIAAGTVFRGDVPEDGRLVTGGRAEPVQKAFIPGLYPDLRRKVMNNLTYIANLVALKAWYTQVRSRFMDGAMLEGSLEKLDTALDERISRMKGVADRLSMSEDPMQKGFSGSWNAVEDSLQSHRSFDGDERERNGFLSSLFVPATGVVSYVDAIKALPEPVRLTGTAWLDGIVRRVTVTALNRLPIFS